MFTSIIYWIRTKFLLFKRRKNMNKFVSPERYMAGIAWIEQALTESKSVGLPLTDIPIKLDTIYSFSWQKFLRIFCCVYLIMAEPRRLSLLLSVVSLHVYVNLSARSFNHTPIQLYFLRPQTVGLRFFTRVRLHIWRSVRDSNPWSPPWQGGMLDLYTNEPIFR